MLWGFKMDCSQNPSQKESRSEDGAPRQPNSQDLGTPIVP